MVANKEWWKALWGLLLGNLHFKSLETVGDGIEGVIADAFRDAVNSMVAGHGQDDAMVGMFRETEISKTFPSQLREYAPSSLFGLFIPVSAFDHYMWTDIQSMAIIYEVWSFDGDGKPYYGILGQRNLAHSHPQHHFLILRFLRYDSSYDVLMAKSMLTTLRRIMRGQVRSNNLSEIREEQISGRTFLGYCRPVMGQVLSVVKESDGDSLLVKFQEVEPTDDEEEHDPAFEEIGWYPLFPTLPGWALHGHRWSAVIEGGLSSDQLYESPANLSDFYWFGQAEIE